jgi:hypothetical protein
MKKLVLFFIDGLGLGPDDPESNPLRSLFTGLMSGKKLIDTDGPVFFPNGVMIPTDATLGVPGIPQSATGQTSIFTGVNAQKHIGLHLSAYPNKELRMLIEKHSLMKKLRKGGIRSTSANLYSQEFFAKRENHRKNLFPASTLTIRASGSKFRFRDDYLAGQAVFADITNELIRKRGYQIDIIRPEQAGRNMLNIMISNDFIFFEYFMTDLYGHSQNGTELKKCKNILERFTQTLWEGIDKKNSGILVVSDHGNAEDISVVHHTTNKTPTLLFTSNRSVQELFASRIRSLTDIYGAVLEYFGINH